MSRSGSIVAPARAGQNAIRLRPDEAVASQVLAALDALQQKRVLSAGDLQIGGDGRLQVRRNLAEDGQQVAVSGQRPCFLQRRVVRFVFHLLPPGQTKTPRHRDEGLISWCHPSCRKQSSGISCQVRSATDGLIPWALLTVPAPASPTVHRRRFRGCGSQVHSYRCAGAGFHLSRLSAVWSDTASLSDVLVLFFADAYSVYATITALKTGVKLAASFHLDKKRAFARIVSVEIRLRPPATSR